MITHFCGQHYVRLISFRNDGDSKIYNLKVISFPILILLVFLYQKLYLLKMVILLILQLVSVMHIRMEILSHSAVTFQTLQSLVGLENTLSNVQDGLTHSLALSYIISVNDKLTLTPSISLSRMFYKKELITEEKDQTYILGGTASYT